MLISENKTQLIEVHADNLDDTRESLSYPRQRKAYNSNGGYEMKELLTPKEKERATEPLKHVYKTLNDAAKCAVSIYSVVEPAETGKLVRVQFDPLKNPITPNMRWHYYRQQKATWGTEMKLHIRKNYAKATPSDDAVDMMRKYLEQAIVNDYPVHDQKVRAALADFVMSVRTDGFKDEDTTGTQMGNFQGKWHGGGFG